MPNSADDIRSMSTSIGALESFAEAAGRRLERMEDKLDQIAMVKQRVDRIEPLVDVHERNKNQGKGAMATIAALSGGTVVGLVEFIKAQLTRG